MPREQLLGLAADVERLLAAGIANAGTDSVRRRAKTIRELGAKVPALVAIADAAERVTEPTSAGPALLDLLVITRQVRASLTTSAIDGTLTPLPESGPWQTPVPVRDLQPLHEALTQSGPGRDERVKDAAARKLFGDLRLVSALMDALGGSYAPVAEAAADVGLPALGRGVLTELQSGLDLSGKAVDVRRLRAVCLIDIGVGSALCRRALDHGNSALRTEALKRLAASEGDEAEHAGLRFCGDKNRDVRVAAMSALGTGRSDAALDGLFKGLDDKESDVQLAAVEALGSVNHAAATRRLLERLSAGHDTQEAATRASTAAKGKRSKSPNHVTPAAAQLREADQQTVLCMVALGKRKDGDLKAVANAIFRFLLFSDYIGYHSAAVEALVSLGPVSNELVSALVAATETESGALAVLVLESFPPASRTVALPALLALAERKGADFRGRYGALRVLAAHVDDCRADVLRVARAALADKTLYENQGIAETMEAIGIMGPAAKPLLPDILNAYRNVPEKPTFAPPACRGIIARLDPDGNEAIPVLMELLRHKKAATQALALQALAGYGAKAAETRPEIERLTASKDRFVCLHAMEALAAVR
jgi:HEAT repeat protein